MRKQQIIIEHIPAIIWGEKSDKVTLFVHGKMSNKESAEQIAKILECRGCQTISFDLPEHGERIHKKDKCDIWTGIRDLTAIGNYTFSTWKTVSLYACSLGAFFSLHAYHNRKFKNCLFQSPIVDMNYLIQQMFLWFSVSEEELKEKKQIQTSIDTLSWEYYRYVQNHPITIWNAPTKILYAEKDTLQNRIVIDNFAEKFHCQLTVAKESDHAFLSKDDVQIVEKWITENIE